MVDTDLSDHKMIEFQFNFLQKGTDVDIRNMPRKISQAGMRRAATDKETVEGLLAR